VQDHLAAQVVPHLDVFFVFMGGLIDLVIPLGLEEKVPRLPADHGDEPADQSGCHGIREHHDVGNEKADGAQQVQGLIDSALVVVTVIVPSLSSQFFPKILHGGFLE